MMVLLYLIWPIVFNILCGGDNGITQGTLSLEPRRTCAGYDSPEEQECE